MTTAALQKGWLIECLFIFPIKQPICKSNMSNKVTFHRYDEQPSEGISPAHSEQVADELSLTLSFD